LIETLDAEKERKDKRGFVKGKAYFFTLAHYIGDGVKVKKLQRELKKSGGIKGKVTSIIAIAGLGAGLFFYQLI